MQSSECQITCFVRFLYLRLDFCPRLFSYNELKDVFFNSNKDTKNKGIVLE